MCVVDGIVVVVFMDIFVVFFVNISGVVEMKCIKNMLF